MKTIIIEHLEKLELYKVEIHTETLPIIECYMNQRQLDDFEEISTVNNDTLITTVGEILNKPASTVFYHINPLSCGHKIQDQVRLVEFTVYDYVKVELIEGCETLKLKVAYLSNEYRTMGEEYTGDLLSTNKILTTCKETALRKLKEVHNGSYADRLKSHHDQCNLGFAFLGMLD